MREELDLYFEILADVDRATLSAWHILNTEERGGIPYPNVYVIDDQLEIVFHSPDKLASRVDSGPVLAFLAAHREDPALRVVNSERARFMPKAKELLLGPLKYHGLIKN